ncbi:hypothetical protein ACTFIW_000674 [Dictyostelium discoideum]
MTIIASIISLSNPKQSTTGSVSTVSAAYKFGSNSVSCGGGGGGSGSGSGSGLGSGSSSGLLGGVLGGNKGLLGGLLGGLGGSPNANVGGGPQTGSMMGPCPCGCN